MNRPAALSHTLMSRVDAMQSWSAPSVPVLAGRGPQLRLYDSADRQVRPVSAGATATMYVCGITPYDVTHLGHAATYVWSDAVDLVLTGRSTGVALYVTDQDPTGVADLTPVVTDDAGPKATLTPPSPVTGRYVVVWLTSLPAVSGGFRGQIDEVVVRGS